MSRGKSLNIRKGIKLIFPITASLDIYYYALWCAMIAIPGLMPALNCTEQ
jgi:hypothetical protein